jgi:hypothetical protein
MNFEDMFELQVENGGMGYRLFWILLCSVLATVMALLFRFKMFSALG